MMNKKEQFIYDTYPIVYMYLNELGLDGRTYAPYILAQAAYESDHGQKVSGDYNYFGMKAKKGDNSKSVSTHEGYGASRIKTSAQFANFKSMEDGLKQGIDRLYNDFNQFHDLVPSPEKWIQNSLHGKYGKYFTDDPQVYLKNFKGVLNGSIINRIISTYYPDQSNSFNPSQYFTFPTQQTKPPYKPKTWQDYLNIPKNKLRGHLKPRLIPRKKHF